MPDKKKRADWAVFKRTKADGARFDGYYVRWVDARGGNHTTYAGRTKELAQAMLKKKRGARDQRDFQTNILPGIISNI